MGSQFKSKESLIFKLKKIKCKECGSNLQEQKVTDIKWNMNCKCNYLKFTVSTNHYDEIDRHLFGWDSIVLIHKDNIDLIQMYFNNDFKLIFRLYQISENYFDFNNTRLIFDRPILFSINRIEKALNVYSGIERNFIFK